jgi:hypothetical protein
MLHGSKLGLQIFLSSLGPLFLEEKEMTKNQEIILNWCTCGEFFKLLLTYAILCQLISPKLKWRGRVEKFMFVNTSEVV